MIKFQKYLIRHYSLFLLRKRLEFIYKCKKRPIPTFLIGVNIGLVIFCYTDIISLAN